jgi:hypothetical protein
MSLSTSPAHLAKWGVRAVGGPLNGQIVDDAPLLWRTIRQDGGCYRLEGKADGGFVYVWADLASLDEG